MKELLKNILSLRRYYFLYAKNAIFVSWHCINLRFSHSLTWHVSIGPAIVNIISCIYKQKSPATDQYWWRFGPAKFDGSMAEFEAETRRAVKRSIFVCFHRFLHIIAAYDIIYYHANRNNNTTTTWYKNTINNAEVMCDGKNSWLVDGVWRIVCCTVESRHSFGRCERSSILYLVEFFTRHT